MNYKIFFIIFCLSAHQLQSQIDPETQTKALIKSFENKTFKLNVEELTTIKNMLYLLITSSSNIITQASSLLKKNLIDQMNKYKKEIDILQAEKKPIPFTLWRTFHLLQEQSEHVKEFISKQPSQTLWQELVSTAYSTLDWLAIYQAPEIKKIKELAQCMIDFVTIEREKILFSYPSTIEFLALQKNIDFPAPINFWKEKHHRFRLIQDAKQMSDKIETQSFIIEMIVQTAIMLGESRYEGWVSEADQNYYKQLADLEKKIQKDFTSWQTNLADTQKASIARLSNAYSKSIATLNNQRNLSDTLYKNEVTTLNNLYDNSPPQNMYVYDPIGFDQAFEISPMYTPNNGFTWYNIYPQPNNVLTYAAIKDPNIITTSDWEYNETLEQFFQNNLVPFQASQKIQDTYSEVIPANYLPDTGQYAHNNNIFCEYINDGQSYEIDIDTTIINASFPFFAGIMFNKARWISGVTERIEQYRLFGIYGIINDQGVKKVNIGFAEYNYKPAADKKSKPTITAPLTQIMAANYTPLAELDNASIENLGKNLLKLNLKILTQSTAVTLSASIINEQQNKTYLIQDKTISGLNPLIYIYHGIGCMAPGTQAAFKINKPTALTYNDIQKKNFTSFITDKLALQKS